MLKRCYLQHAEHALPPLDRDGAVSVDVVEEGACRASEGRSRGRCACADARSVSLLVGRQHTYLFVVT